MTNDRSTMQDVIWINDYGLDLGGVIIGDYHETKSRMD
jgi:hypothetical protein